MALKCATIFTCELDEPEVALAELKQQLDEKLTLKANTVGVIQCHPEFVLSGIVEYIAKELPFEIAGTTTASQATNDVVSELVLTIFVMTADDVSFYVGKTDCLQESIAPYIESALDGVDRAAKLALVFPPLLIQYPGDSHVEAWAEALPGVPVYGTLAISDALDFSNSTCIYNEESLDSSTTFILCYGNINPRFLIATLPDNTALPYTGEITKADGVLVHEIDGGNALEYMRTMGFVNDDETLSVYWFVPFSIHQKTREDFDGVPVLRGFYMPNEDGSGIFRGKVDQGSTFTMLNMTDEATMIESTEKIGDITRLDNVNGALVYSCIVRRMVLMNADSVQELAMARNTLGDIPFMMAYAGGEICPTSIKAAGATNRFHNFTMVILVL